MVKKKVSRFFAVICDLILKSLKKVLIWCEIKKFKIKTGTKNSELHVNFKSVEKVFKKCTKKGY